VLSAIFYLIFMFIYKKITVHELLHAQMSMPIAQAYFHGNLCTGQNRPLIGYLLKELDDPLG
jgi:hypothetical protein